MITLTKGNRLTRTELGQKYKWYLKHKDELNMIVLEDNLKELDKDYNELAKDLYILKGGKVRSKSQYFEKGKLTKLKLCVRYSIKSDVDLDIKKWERILNFFKKESKRKSVFVLCFIDK